MLKEFEKEPSSKNCAECDRGFKSKEKTMKHLKEVHGINLDFT